MANYELSFQTRFGTHFLSPASIPIYSFASSTRRIVSQRATNRPEYIISSVPTFFSNISVSYVINVMLPSFLLSFLVSSSIPFFPSSFSLSYLLTRFPCLRCYSLFVSLPLGFIICFCFSFCFYISIFSSVLLPYFRRFRSTRLPLIPCVPPSQADCVTTY
jgi:hypothetical protein